ncbi:MAG: hypothetical protein JNM27_16970 [Leptospirales bacterium]|nr:hypothetical protein [Leptospirales bacterium]
MIDAASIVAFLGRLSPGQSLAVPFSTELYPDTRVWENILTRVSESEFLLETRYSEFAPGHGFSLTMREQESLSRAQLEGLLRSLETLPELP